MSDRRVDVVRLRAGSDALVRRGTILLEDGLRTASLPEVAAGRVLVLRSLSVGTIRADRSPSSVAMAIEQRVRGLAGAAVHALDPSAASRDAVFFADDAEPCVALAAALARSAAADAWFWPLAVRGFRRGMAVGEGTRVALLAALATDARAAAVVRLLAALAEVDALAPLLGALRRDDGAALVREFGGDPGPPTAPSSGGSGDRTAPDPVVSRPSRAAIERSVRAWGPGDPRTRWLAAAVLAVELPARLVDRRLFERADAVIAASASSRRADDPRRTGGAPEQERQARSEPEPARVRGRADRSVERRAGEAARLVEGPPPAASAAAEVDAGGPGGAAEAPAERPGSRSEAAASSRDADATRPPRHRAAGLAGAPSAGSTEPLATAAGGLYFLIPVFSRLGIAELLDAHPRLIELQFVPRLFALVAGRLGVAAADPALAAVCPGPPIWPAGDGSFELPSRFHAVIAPGPRLGETADLAGLVRAFVVGARRIVRRRVELGLRPIVLRPARMTSSSTHIDVLFDHRQADIRLRRAGLDVDPSWVPWLGRVVRYHYLHGELPASA